MSTKRDLTPEKEAKAIQTLISLLGDKMKRESAGPGKMQRDAHPKQIALLNAEFIVEKDLPEEFKVGVFASKQSYSAFVRFSNQNAPAQKDNVKDIRGMAIKLLDVKYPNDSETTHDFITISTDVFVTKNIVEFADLISALARGKLFLVFYFLTHPRNAWNFFQSNKNFGSLLEARFFSVSPYSFGNKVVKYSVRPHGTRQTDIGVHSTTDYLTSVMEKQLHKDDYFFDFMVQFQKDPVTMPIEDLSVRWKEEDSPFIKVATIKIPAQVFNTPERKKFGEQLSFTPWHCLPEHTPLGGVNRGRKIIYDALSELRHASNKAPRVEPTDPELKTN